MLNPIKTPQEMLMEETGLPHYAPGGSVLSAGARQLVEKAIKQYTRLHGKMPSAQEMAQLEQEVSKLSKPTSTMQGANVARMQAQEPYANKLVDEAGRVYEPGSGAQFGVPNPNKLPTPGERNYGVSKPRWVPDDQGGGSFVRDDKMRTAFDPRDDFLTYQMTGRRNVSTDQVPFTTNIDELQGQSRAAVGSPNQPLEALDNGPGPVMQRSTEPSYDPHDIDYADDAPVSSMTLRSDVTPGASAIAQMADRVNLPHDYTGKGDAAMAELIAFRNQLKAGTPSKDLRLELERLQQEAINSGVAPTAVNAPPSKLGRFKNILKEIEMGPPGPEVSMGGYAQGGHISPNDMRHMMIAYGHEPEHFRKGGRSLRHLAANINRHPGQALFNTMGFSDVADQGYNAYKSAQAGNVPATAENLFNTAAAVPAALPSVPLTASMAVPYGGQAITNQAATHMAQNPQFRQQMSNMSQSPLGGALGGDAALASQIMGNRDYSDVLAQRQQQQEATPEPQEAPRGLSLLQQRTMKPNI